MPKALLLRRPSGLFVRFKLPTDIRARVGALFVVRSLRGETGDAARLTAARLGYALGEAIARVRQGVPDVDAKKLIEAAMAAAPEAGTKRPYEVTIPGVGTIRADSAEDHARALEALAAMRVVVPGLSAVAPAGASPVVVPGPMLHASAQLFLTHYAGTNRAAATLLEATHTLHLFCDLINDLPLAQVGPEQVDVFRDALSHWPVRARVMPDYKGLSARAIVEKAKKAGTGGVSVRTLDKHFDRLRTFFNWAVQRRHLAHNPLSGLRLQTTAEKYTPKRRGFQPAELALLFEPTRRAELCDDDPMYFWVPVVCLMTGARLREIAQLRLTDLDQVADIWGIHITPESTKSVKNRQSRRFVPLPERVLALGLLAYADDVRAQGFPTLFPGGSDESKNGPGDRVGKWFNRTLLRVSCGIDDPEVSFHSTRHTFVSASDRLGFTEAQGGALTGHEARSVMARHYIDGATVPERKMRVDRIAASLVLPPLAPYRPGQFVGYFEDVRRDEKRAKAVAERQARAKKAKKKREA